jgi:CPA2 family monovalent cation:H+ antiporter-2
MALSLVLAVHVLRHMIASYVVPFLADLRSVELVVLFSVLVLAGMCWAADRMGLPAAIGALAAGLMLSGNRMTKQIDTLVLPFRESFSAVFFVTLGTLLDPSTFLREPVLLLSCLIGVIGLKSLAAMLALRVTGLSWRASAGMGVGLSQLGEFSFLLISIGVAQGIVSATDYNRVLFIAMGTLVLTPQLIKRGLTWTDGEEMDADPSMVGLRAATYAQHAIVIGAGLIGRKTAARLETLGVDVCLIDQSPINLYPFAQQGFLTVTGDAVDPDVLSRAFAKTCKLCVVCVPDDRIANQIVTTLRRTNPSMFILVRCRYFTNVASLISSGADTAISEEQEASAAILRVCERILWQQNREDELPPSTG